MSHRRSIETGLRVMALSTAFVSAACTDDGVALHIECNIAPEISETGCVWSPMSDACVFDGRMNLRAAQDYYAGFRVRSGLKARVTTSPPRAEPNGVQLQEVEVELRAPGGRVLGLGLPNPYSLVTSGYVAPEGTGLLQVQLIPPAYADALREQETSPKTAIGQIVAVVKAKGITDGQVKVNSAEFFWPIRLIYKSPVVGDNECTVSEIGTCAVLRGADSLAEVCGCPGPDASPKDRSCDLESSE